MNKLVFDPADLEQYRLQASVADFDAEMATYKQASERARVALEACFSTHAYGDDPTEKTGYLCRQPGWRPGLPVHSWGLLAHVVQG